ncbi:aromatic prenyltransferase [Xylaria venustula]|nr:aromatic prenyltransferase [Xylaria venustula]
MPGYSEDGWKTLHEVGSQYWWETTGRDLANMLHAAEYPEHIQQAFLSYYNDFICPHLGDADGSTHEYSFEIRGSTKTLYVRFVADFSQLRPVDWDNPLNCARTETVIASLASRAPGFDDTWYRALKKSLDHSHLPAPAQKALIAEAGHLTPLLIGFDIYRDIPKGSDMLPVMGKAYFLPCFAAAAQKKTRFEILRTAILDLPGISSRPNILRSLSLLEEYLTSKSKDWENGARFLSTDLVSPDKARLKLYLRCPVNSFEVIWDYFTLGGRIPGLGIAKDSYLKFVSILGGAGLNYLSTTAPVAGEGIETGNRRKLTTVYFSLDDKHPFPAPKLAFCVRNVAANDVVVVRGLDRWLSSHGWDDGETSMEDYISSSRTHRKLIEKPGIFTFIGLARKDPTGELSIQTYLCPELYESPRPSEKP